MKMITQKVPYKKYGGDIANFVIKLEASQCWSFGDNIIGAYFMETLMEILENGLLNLG